MSIEKTGRKHVGYQTTENSKNTIENVPRTAENELNIWCCFPLECTVHTYCIKKKKNQEDIFIEHQGFDHHSTNLCHTTQGRTTLIA